MKIYIMVDMEGISGIMRSEQVMSDQAPYQAARMFMVGDVNACVEGCFRGGATKIVVRDAHGGGFNMPWDAVDPRVELVQGQEEIGRMHDIGKYDALILLGYHAMAGTRHAVLEHTMTSKGWQNFYLNGKRAGEFAIDAGIAGDAGVPTIMTSGDDKLCREARRWVKKICAAQVKVGLGRFGARLLSQPAAHELIMKTAEKACNNYKTIPPLVHEKPVKMRLEVVERGGVPAECAGKSYLKVIDGRTYEVSGSTTREALSRL